MNPLRVYIIEDEPLIASTIETMLLKQGYNVCGDSDNAKEALKEVKLLQPDLVLIDIQLEGKATGIDVALQLDDIDVPYLYLTSQTDPKTIEEVKRTKPLGYIVKPFTEASLRSNIEVAWNNYYQQEQDVLVFTSNNLSHKIKQSQILYLKAFDNYCYIITKKTQYLVPKTLKFIESKLNPDLFIKTHRSFIVNVSKIVSISKKSVLINDTEIPLSKAHKEVVKQVFES